MHSAVLCGALLLNLAIVDRDASRTFPATFPPLTPSPPTLGPEVMAQVCSHYEDFVPTAGFVDFDDLAGPAANLGTVVRAFIEKKCAA